MSNLAVSVLVKHDNGLTLCRISDMVLLIDDKVPQSRRSA